MYRLSCRQDPFPLHGAELSGQGRVALAGVQSAVQELRQGGLLESV